MTTIPEALSTMDATKVQAAAAKAATTHWADYAGGDAFFALWMALVDRRIQRRIGLGLMDLADQTYRDWYDDGITPRQAAELAIHGDDTFGDIDW